MKKCRKDRAPRNFALTNRGGALIPPTYTGFEQRERKVRATWIRGNTSWEVWSAGANLWGAGYEKLKNMAIPGGCHQSHALVQKEGAQSKR